MRVFATGGFLSSLLLPSSFRPGEGKKRSAERFLIRHQVERLQWWSDGGLFQSPQPSKEEQPRSSLHPGGGEPFLSTPVITIMLNKHHQAEGMRARRRQRITPECVRTGAVTLSR